MLIFFSKISFSIFFPGLKIIEKKIFFCVFDKFSKNMFQANDIDHLPVPFNYRMDESELYNRNLLAARYYEKTEDSGAKLKIWTVNERSKRHYLEGFQFDVRLFF